MAGGFDPKSHINVGLIIEGFQLPAVDPLYSDWRLTRALHNPNTTPSEFQAMGGGGYREAVTISAAPTIDVTYRYVGIDRGAAQQVMEGLSGDGCRVAFSQDSTTFTPSADNPIRGSYAHVPAFQRGGEAATEMVWENTLMSGKEETLVSPLDAPANPVATLDGADIDVTWDADSTALAEFPTVAKIRGYNVYRSGTAGGSLADPYVKINATEVANPTAGTVEYTDLSPGTGTWYYVVEAVWEFGVRSPFSAEVSAIVP